MLRFVGYQKYFKLVLKRILVGLRVIKFTGGFEDIELLKALGFVTLLRAYF